MGNGLASAARAVCTHLRPGLCSRRLAEDDKKNRSPKNLAASLPGASPTPGPRSAGRAEQRDHQPQPPRPRSRSAARPARWPSRTGRNGTPPRSENRSAGSRWRDS